MEISSPVSHDFSLAYINAQTPSDVQLENSIGEKGAYASFLLLLQCPEYDWSGTALQRLSGDAPTASLAAQSWCKTYTLVAFFLHPKIVHQIKVATN